MFERAFDIDPIGVRERRVGDPGIVGHVLQHRPQALEPRMACEFVDLRDGVAGLDIHPADDAANKRMLVGQLQQEAGVGDAGQRLNQHRALDARALQLGQQIVRHEVAVNGGQRRRRPLPLTVSETPEVLVGIDAHLHLGA